MKHNLDFICIGAPKAATSTLFELIEGHPEIFIPPAKEVPYFNDDEMIEKGWDWYIKTFFLEAKKHQKIGTLTPQYMSGFGVNSPERIAERIKEQCSKTKIILMARQPIERSFSHFKMHKRHGYLEGAYEDNVNKLLKSNLKKERNDLSQRNSFLFASEYGRILSKYHELFGSENVMLILTDEIERDPSRIVRNVFEFIGVDETYQPPNLNVHSNKGGSKAKIKYLNSAYVHKFPFVKWVWTSFVPPRLRKKIYLKVLLWNTRIDNTSVDRQSQTYKKLVKFYEPDIRLLKKVSGRSLPWPDWN